MALARTLRFGLNKKGRINQKAGRPREAMPFLRNVPGMRYVRDAQKPGLIPKRVPR